MCVYVCVLTVPGAEKNNRRLVKLIFTEDRTKKKKDSTCVCDWSSIVVPIHLRVSNNISSNNKPMAYPCRIRLAGLGIDVLSINSE